LDLRPHSRLVFCLCATDPSPPLANQAEGRLDLPPFPLPLLFCLWSTPPNSRFSFFFDCGAKSHLLRPLNLDEFRDHETVRVAQRLKCVVFSFPARKTPPLVCPIKFRNAASPLEARAILPGIFCTAGHPNGQLFFVDPDERALPLQFSLPFRFSRYTCSAFRVGTIFHPVVFPAGLLRRRDRLFPPLPLDAPACSAPQIPRFFGLILRNIIGFVSFFS